MKNLRYVSLISIVAAVVFAVSFAASGSRQTPHLQKGISVQMAATSNAAEMPQADDENAWVVTVTENGDLYFGVQPVTVDDLMEKMKATPRNRDQNLYIKADARAPFANVMRVLRAGNEVWFQTPVLLTQQRLPATSGAVIPPNGLQVLVGPTPPPGSVATLVEMLNTQQGRPSLRVNGEEISWSALGSILRQHFQKGDDRIILLKAAERLPFGEVVQVIDTCRATGAKVVLDTPGV